MPHVSLWWKTSEEAGRPLTKFFKADSTTISGALCLPCTATSETRTTATKFVEQTPRQHRVPHVSLCWRRERPERLLASSSRTKHHYQIGCPMSPSVGDVRDQDNRSPVLKKQAPLPTSGAPCLPLLETWETRKTARQPFEGKLYYQHRVPHVSLCWRRGKPGRPLASPSKASSTTNIGCPMSPSVGDVGDQDNRLASPSESRLHDQHRVPHVSLCWRRGDQDAPQQHAYTPFSVPVPDVTELVGSRNGSTSIRS